MSVTPDLPSPAARERRSEESTGDRQQRSFKTAYADRLPLWVAAGAAVGILVGLFFGDDAAVVRPIGMIYVMLMQVVVFPYIICSLLHGLGQLTPDTALRLLRCSWLVYLLVWGVTIGSILLLTLAIPSPPPPSFIDHTAPAAGLDLLTLLIPADPFADLVNNYIPAIVVFSIIYGVAIQHVPNKAGFLEILDVIRKASVTIWGWVVMLAPIGVAALFADTAGTVRPEAAAGLSLYLIAIMGGTLILAFWLLPSLIAALVPTTTREVLRDVRNGLVIAVVTTLSVAALPFIQQAAEKLADRLKIEDENRSDITRTTLAVAYPLAQLGNFFILMFMLFGAFYFRVPISWSDQMALPFVSLLAGVGSPSSSIDAIGFLSDWLSFPTDATPLYVAMMTLTRYGQVVASVMGFAFVTFLVMANYYGRLTLNVGKLALSLGVGAAMLVAVTAIGHIVQKEFVGDRQSSYLDFALSPEVTRGTQASFGAASAADAPQATDTGTAVPPAGLPRIQQTGEIRVGVNPNMIPFSYHNSDGDLVGFDISYVYQLARDLNVNLRLVPFEWYELVDDLKNDRFDLAASAIYVNNERLRELGVSDPYYQSRIALIVRAENADEFMDHDAIAARTDLVIGALKDPILTPMAQTLFPNARLEILDNYRMLSTRHDIDGVIWSLEQAKAFSEPRPEFTAVVPDNLGGKFLFAYLMPSGHPDFLSLINNWLRLQEANGFHARMVDHWIDGKAMEKPPPRWSIMRDVLGWGTNH